MKGSHRLYLNDTIADPPFVSATTLVSSAPPPATSSASASASAEASEEIEKLKHNLKEMKAAAKAQIKAMKGNLIDLYIHCVYG